MKLKNIWMNITAIVVVMYTVISCDDDFNSVGGEVIGDVNFENNQYITEPISYSRVFEKVQTNGLPNNLLGVYEDPVYGTSTYSILSQIGITSGVYNPVFGLEAVLDSVVFTLPYFSTVTQSIINEEGETETTYELDSIYNAEEAIKLSLYRSNYFLRDFDPNPTDPDDPDSPFGQSQLYYSDDVSNFGLTNLTEDSENFIASIDQFVPTAKEVRLKTPDGDDDGTERDVTKVSPRLRLSLISDEAATILNAGFNDNRISNQQAIDQFTSWFLDKEGSSELSNINNFRNYFKGIYLKAEPVSPGSSAGNLVFFNILNANITLHYTFQKLDSSDDNDNGDTTDYIADTESLDFSFSNNIVNGIENAFESSILEKLKKDQDTVNGENNLYLKGGEGSYAVLDLFSRSVETDNNGDYVLDDNENPVFKDVVGEDDKTELDFLRDQDWLINDAFIKLYIDRDQVVSGDTEPERIYIFDIETGNILIDYSDDSQDTSDSVNSVINHLGRISSDDNGSFYQIRLTRHIINVLNLDVDNVKLGIAVSQNVNVTSITNGFIPDGKDDDEKDDNVILPVSSIISHEGTILYGNGTDVPENIRLKLQISYTKLKNN